MVERWILSLMDELLLVASVNTFCVICETSVVIEAWGKIDYVDVDVD